MTNTTNPKLDKPITAICKACKDIMVSERGGHFVSCKCEKSFIDRDRWFPERVRLGGEAEILEQSTGGKG